MSFLVISSSLNPSSRSRILAEVAVDSFRQFDVAIQFIDMRRYPLPLCDGGESYNHPNVIHLKEEIHEAEAILIATPIYNYDVNAVIKNVIELTNKVWQNKVVGFLCSAGARSSYMGVMAFASSLMLDFRTFIIPGFVFCQSSDFENHVLTNELVHKRILRLTEESIRIGRAINALYQT